MNNDDSDQYEKRAIKLAILEKYLVEEKEEIEKAKQFLQEKYHALPKAVEFGLSDENYLDGYVIEYLNEIERMRIRRRLAFFVRNLLGRLETILSIGLFFVVLVLIEAKNLGKYTLSAYIGCGIYILIFILVKVLFEQRLKSISYSIKDIALVLEAKYISTITQIRYDDGSGKRFHTSELNIRADLKYEICKAVIDQMNSINKMGLFNVTSYFIAIDYLAQNYANYIAESEYIKKGISALYLVLGYRPESIFFREKMIEYLIINNEIDDAERMISLLDAKWPLQLTKEIQTSYINYCRAIKMCY